METFDFKPFQHIGNISFSMKRDSLRSLFGQFNEFRKNKFSKNTTDDFGKFHVYYDYDNLVEAVEFWSDVIVYNDVRLFSQSLESLKELFSNYKLEEEDGSIEIPELGLVIGFAENVIDSILVYRKGY